jgi:hypothetical protein
MHGRGGYLCLNMQWIIDQLQNDPDIINMPRLPADNPDESQMGPSGPEFIDLDEITGLDDPEFTMPPTGSPTNVSAQPGTVEASQRTGVSNPLSEIIKIYDDDESPEVSLVTHVHIEEEKGPENISSPVPDAQIQEVPQKEKEAESVLDTKLPDVPETRADILKDESGSDEPKEEAPQQEINVSMTDEQVSIDSILNASISIGTQTLDER